MNDILKMIFSTRFVFSSLQMATPILFAALGSLIADRAGILNIGLEGIMLFAALAGVIGSAYSQSLLVGMFCAMLTGVVIACIMAYFSLTMKADIILTGVAVNLVAAGGTVFVLYTVCGDKGVSTSLNSLVFPTLSLPLIKDIPILGEILSGHNVLTYLALLLVPGVWYFMEKSKTGLRIRAVGENENAASSVGVKVNRIRYLAVILSGLFASLGGVFLSMGMLTYFSKNMSAGRGFIALAAEALGRGTVVGTLCASLVFGVADSLSVSVQGKGIPPQFVQMLPYAATILGLVLYSVTKKERGKKKYRYKKGTRSFDS